MKKIFSYIVGVILVLSSVIAISHFVTPSEDKNINAESVEYITLPFDCFYLTTDYYNSKYGSKVELGTAGEELNLGSTHSLKDSQTYAILGLKPTYYTIQNGKYAGKSLLEVVSEHKYIELPTTIDIGSESNSVTYGYIVGISYVVDGEAQRQKGYPYYSFVSGDSVEDDHGAFEIEDITLSESDLTLTTPNLPARYIKGIRIPKTYTRIGANAFKNMPSLERVEFQNNDVGKKTFDSGVFQDCKKLSSVTVQNSGYIIPNSQTSIPSDTFLCTAITEAYIPNTIDTIRDGAFRDCLYLTSVTFEEDSTLRYIDTYSFKNCVYLESFVLPSTVKTIYNYAFQNTFSLKKLSIHNGVTYIGARAFSFSETAYDYGNYANSIYPFEEISKIISFDSPRTIVLGDSFGNSSLNAVNASDYTPEIVDTAFYTDDKDADYTKYYYVYSHDLSPNTYKHLIENVFVESQTSVCHIPYTVLNAKYYVKKDNTSTEISGDLFGSANAVPTTYNIGGKLAVDNNGISNNFDQYTSLGLDAYDFKGYSMELYVGDTLISSIDLDSDIIINDQTSIYTDVRVYANYEIKQYSVTINNMLCKDAVNHGTELKSVFADSYLYNGDLDPQNLNFVGVYTDSNYTNLVNWEDQVTSDITLYSRNVAFENLYKFEYDSASDGYIIAGLKSNIGAVSQLYIPATYNAKPVIGIRDRAFINNNTLSKLYFADFDKSSTFTIGSYAFQGCSNLTYAELPASNLTVKTNAFVSTGITEITLLGSATNGSRGSYNIHENALPNDCKILKSSCDTNDKDIAAKDISVEIDINNTKISYELFPHHFVYLPTENDEITYISGYYFVRYMIDCNDGNGFKGDLEGGYYEYAKLSKVISSNQKAIIDFKAVFECKFDISEKIVDGESEKTVNGWSLDYLDFVENTYDNDTKYFEVVDLPEDANKISDEAFKEDLNIKKVVVNSLLTEIGESAFNGCVNLREVFFREGYNQELSIKKSAFKSCTSLTSFGKISEDDFVVVKFFGESAFEDCTNLQYVYLSNNSTLSSLGKCAFKNCKKLLTFTIPKSVIEIGEECFENCSALTSVVFADDSKLSSIQGKAFCNSGITNINFDKTQLKYISSEVFKNTDNLVAISLVSKADKLSLYSNSNDIFNGSSVREITLPGNMELNGISFKSVFNGANNLQNVVIATDGDYQNYNNDGIIYHRTGDMVSLNGAEVPELAIDFIPYAYTGTLTIPACVSSINSTDGKVLSFFNSLKNVTDVVGNRDFTADWYKYIVIDGDLYYHSGESYMLVFVPNRVYDNGVYEVGLNTTDIYDYAFNSNTNIKVLTFNHSLDGVIGENLPSLYSDSIEAIVLPKFVKKISSNNFVNLTNLKTIRIVDTVEGGRELPTFDNPTSTFVNPVVFIVPAEDLSIYVSAPGFDGFVIRSMLNITFEANEGTRLPNTEFEFGSVPTNLPQAEKTGHDFVGWYVDEELTTPYNADVEYADLHLYAGYKIHIYTYTYMVDNGTYFTQEVAYGSKASGPESVPTKKGKVFVGWKTEDGVEYSLDSNNVSSDLVLYAEFKTDNKYITKLIIIAVAFVVVLGVVITIIAKSVKKKKAYKK